MDADSIKTSVLIVGGGTGGFAAALALGRRGIRCVVTEPTDWIGGQLTSQAVPPDENRWIEGREGVQSATQSYLDFRENVRRYYRTHRKLTAAAAANPQLNPGNGWVSHLCHEPRVAHQVLREMLEPHIAAGTVTLLLETDPVNVEIDHDRIDCVIVRDRRTQTHKSIRADYVLEATELGDVLALSGIEHHVGAEHRDTHGELHGRPDNADPSDVQAISWCFALEYRPEEDHTISKPAHYDFWRDYVPPTTPPWTGKLFDWTVPGGEDHSPRMFRWLPPPQEPDPNEWEMWRYRRIVDQSLYVDPQQHVDVSLVNMAQMDYFLKPTLSGSAEQQKAVFDEARELSLCLLYWMQTDAPRFDKADRVGFPGLKLRGQELGTQDGFAKFPYIREARRLDALQMISERHIGVQQRRAEKLIPADAPPWGSAEPFEDSVGIGHYRLDLHPTPAMRNSIYVHAAPFRISLKAMIPKRMTNLIAAGKALGVSHIANGCYRLHPVEWNIGESAGHLAAYCITEGTTPHQVCEARPHLRRLQRQLVAAGIPLAWPWEKGAGL